MIITLSTNQLKAASFCTSKKDVRFCLNGVYIEKTQSGKTYIVSTNGHFMFCGQLPDNPPGIAESLIIPNETIDIILKMKKDFVVLDTEKMTICDLPFKPIDAKYPDFRMAIPKENHEESGKVSQFNPDYVYTASKALSFWHSGGLKKLDYTSLFHRGNSAATLSLKGCESAFCIIMGMRKEPRDTVFTFDSLEYIKAA